MLGIGAIAHGDDIGVIEIALARLFNEACSYAHLVLYSKSNKGLGGRAAWNRFCQGANLSFRKISHMPVAGNTHLREDDQVDLLKGCLFYKLFDDSKIIGLVVLVVVELY